MNTWMNAASTVRATTTYYTGSPKNSVDSLGRPTYVGCLFSLGPSGSMCNDQNSVCRFVYVLRRWCARIVENLCHSFFAYSRFGRVTSQPW